MAFLQLKKNFHANKSILFVLLDEPTEGEVRENNFNNTEHVLKCKLGGATNFECAPVNGSSYSLSPDQEFDFIMTSAQYAKIATFSKNDLVFFQYQVGGDGRVSYRATNDEAKINVFLESDSSFDPKPLVRQGMQYGYESVKHRDSSRSDEIKWSMCVKEAVNIVISRSKSEGKSENEYLEILDTAKSLMNVVIDGYKEWETEYIAKKDEELKGSEDIPF